MNNVQISVANLSKFLLNFVAENNLSCLTPEAENLLRIQSVRPTETFSCPLQFGQDGDRGSIFIDLKLDRVERTDDIETLFYKYAFVLAWPRTIEDIEQASVSLLVLTAVCKLAQAIDMYIQNMGPVSMTRSRGREVVLN